ncbi:hypothetical protein Hdeb2414_s0005g00172641 [Helianthus debilis subsp. tardiflorus]
MFRRFFRLARNGDWYTIKKTQCEAALLSTTVGHTYASKNQFFFISNRLLPFTVVPRKFSQDLNEKYPEVHELEQGLLLKLRASHTKLRVYTEELLVVSGICQDDPSGVEIEQREIPEGGPSIVRHTEHVRTAGNLESVPHQPIMDGSSAKKLPAPVRKSTRGTASSSVVPQSSDPISIDSSDEDDAGVVVSVTGVKFLKKEVVPKASGGADDASSLKISAVLKKFNETKRIVPKRPTQALEVGVSDVKVLKTVSKKKIKCIKFRLLYVLTPTKFTNSRNCAKQVTKICFAKYMSLSLETQATKTRRQKILNCDTA